MTIIILLILAVVAIRAVQGDGIITKAKDAKSATTVAQEKEQIGLAVNEWKIQKNYQKDSGYNFKSFMQEKLTNIATIPDSNPASGPLTVRMKDTGNKYIVTDDGTIEGPKVLSTLEKYILGENGDGKELFGKIVSYSGKFLNDSTTISDAETSITMIDNIKEDVNSITYYIEYQGEKYKFAANVPEDLDMTKIITLGTYGVHKLDNLEELKSKNSKVGQYVEYDNKKWIILYDDTINGLQMISAESLQYNGADFNLGYEDTLINWDSLTDEEKNKANLDGDTEKNLTDFEKSVYSYNNAITTLNTVCENLVTKSDNIIDVRCVGSKPTIGSKNSENIIPYESEKLSEWPIGNSNFEAGIANKKCKSTDKNFISDYDRMIVLGIKSAGSAYWLASRLHSYAMTESRSLYPVFNIRYVKSSGNYDNDELVSVTASNAEGSNRNNSLRPVVTLKSDIQFLGSGTTEDPYTF